METIKKDIEWFKKDVEPILTGFKCEYSFFENGDFGDLNRVEFEGNGKGGNIDFWEKNWLEIHLYDYNKDKELIHVLLEPSQKEEKEKALNKLQSNLVILNNKAL